MQLLVENVMVNRKLIHTRNKKCYFSCMAASFVEMLPRVENKTSEIRF